MSEPPLVFFSDNVELHVISLKKEVSTKYTKEMRNAKTFPTQPTHTKPLLERNQRHLLAILDHQGLGASDLTLSFCRAEALSKHHK
jgi:hypothetical protein